MKEKCEKCQTDLIEKDGQKICLHCNPVKHEVPENACQNCKTVPEWDGFAEVRLWVRYYFAVKNNFVKLQKVLKCSLTLSRSTEQPDWKPVFSASDVAKKKLFYTAHF